jgi:hypothetical protein
VTTETQTDWMAWGRREAAAFLGAYPAIADSFSDRDVAVDALACMWLQGVNLGAHETLNAAEEAMERLTP